MSRGVWFVAGAASGIYALVKARRTASALTPDGIGARVAALRAGARVFTDSVQRGMAEREADMRLQLESAPRAGLIGAAPSSPPDVRQVAPAALSPHSEGSVDGHR